MVLFVPRLTSVTAILVVFGLHVSGETATDGHLRKNRSLREEAICHAVGGTQKEEYKLISGIPNAALQNHIEQHGDGIPGGNVPDKPGCTFSPTCEVSCALTFSDPIRVTIGERQAAISDINLFDYALNAVGDLEVIEVNGNAMNVGANVGLGDDFYRNENGESEFLFTFCQGGPDEGREDTPDVWFNIGADGIANFTQNNDTGVDPTCSGFDPAFRTSQFPFRQLGVGESAEPYAIFAVLDSSTGQTAVGTLIVDVIGENDTPIFANGCPGLQGVGEGFGFNENEVQEDQTVSFGNVLERFTDTECNFPLQFGSIGNLVAVVDGIALPASVAGDNGGLYHFESDGTVIFEDTGGFVAGVASSIEVSIADSLGASSPTFSLTTTYVPAPRGDPEGGPVRRE